MLEDEISGDINQRFLPWPAKSQFASSGIVNKSKVSCGRLIKQAAWFGFNCARVLAPQAQDGWAVGLGSTIFS